MFKTNHSSPQSWGAGGFEKQKNMPNDNSAMYNMAGQNFGKAADIMVQTANNKRQRKWALKDYQRNFDDNRINQDRANWYNSPAQQMKRFKEAGLNPNLIYGSGGGGSQTPTQSSAGQPREGNFQPMPSVSGLAGGYMDVIQQRLQNNQITAQTENIKSQTQNNKITTKKGLIDIIDYAKLRGDTVAISQAERLLKVIEAEEMAEYRGAFGTLNIPTEKTSGHQKAKQSIEAHNAGIKQIKASTDNIEQQNAKIRKYNEFIQSLPKGESNMTQLIQVFLYKLLN